MAKQLLESLRIALLDEQHDRGSLTCGIETLDRSLKTQAGQASAGRPMPCSFCAGMASQLTSWAIYTLRAAAIAKGDVPEPAGKHVQRYPLVSPTLIGRPAAVKGRKGWRLGEILLADALQRAHKSASTVGYSMVVADALDEPAAFVRRMGLCDCRLASACVADAACEGRAEQ